MELNQIVINYIAVLLAIGGLIIGILAYIHSINTEGKIFNGKVVDDDGKQVNIRDYFKSGTGIDFMKNYTENDLKFVNYDDNFYLGFVKYEDINANGFRDVHQIIGRDNNGVAQVVQSTQGGPNAKAIPIQIKKA
tara:strand:- start:1447 stop:1851 length:405 start_codon:yes stop_codon:yes gene_type:complete